MFGLASTTRKWKVNSNGQMALKLTTTTSLHGNPMTGVLVKIAQSKREMESGTTSTATPVEVLFA